VVSKGTCGGTCGISLFTGIYVRAARM
jgi:hypothetical protein